MSRDTSVTLSVHGLMVNNWFFEYHVTGKFGGLLVYLVTAKLKSANTLYTYCNPLPNHQIKIRQYFKAQLLNLISANNYFRLYGIPIRFSVTYVTYLVGLTICKAKGGLGACMLMRTRFVEKDNENPESCHWYLASFTLAILSSYNLPPRQLQWARCDSVSAGYTDQVQWA